MDSALSIPSSWRKMWAARPVSATKVPPLAQDRVRYVGERCSPRRPEIQDATARSFPARRQFARMSGVNRCLPLQSGRR
jgi:hypothetical protein